MDVDKQLIDAASTGDLLSVEQRYQAGVSIHADDDYSLRWAARNGHVGVVQFLLEKGADIHAGNDAPLRWASWRGHVEVSAFLFNQDPDYFTTLIEQDGVLSANASLHALANHYRLAAHLQSTGEPRAMRAL